MVFAIAVPLIQGLHEFEKWRMYTILESQIYMWGMFTVGVYCTFLSLIFFALRT